MTVSNACEYTGTRTAPFTSFSTLLFTLESLSNNNYYSMIVVSSQLYCAVVVHQEGLLNAILTRKGKPRPRRAKYLIKITPFALQVDQAGHANVGVSTETMLEVSTLILNTMVSSLT
eukprot:scpid52459/ scgid25715/ 